MKAFTTVSALLGITYANPIQHIQYGSTGLRNINQHSSNMMINKDMLPMSNQIMTQRTVPIMDMVGDMPKPVVNPNQYLEKDNFGNYAFGYSTQNSEMSEVGNAQSKKGHFANIMADGKLRRVDYVADNQGFHILRDTADKTGRYIKREAEAEPLVQPDLIRTRMTSYMDSSSLRDDGKDLHNMSNDMMGREMTSSSMPRNNQMSAMYKSSNMMNQGMSSNTMNQGMPAIMLGHDLTSNVMGREMTSNMMDQHMSNQMMGRGTTNNMMGRDMTFNTMGRDMTFSTMGRDMSTNMMNLDRNMPMMSQTLYTNKMGQHDMVSNLRNPSLLRSDMSADLMERGMMGQDINSNVMDNKNKMMSSNVVMGQNQMTPLNRMSQRMQIETMPSQSLNRFF